MESQSTTTTPDELVGILLSITDIDSLRSNTQLLTSLATLTDDQLLATTLNNNNNNNNSTSDNQTRDIDPLAVLNPTLHSLGYFYFITARGKLVARHDALEYYHALYQFIQVADWNQIKLAGSQMIRMMKALDHLAQVQNDDILPLLPLYTIITRLDTLDTTTTLTVFHSALARRCILAKMYKYPLPILNKDIIQMDPKVHGTTIEHYLEYHYYGAILYIGNKEFDKALDFFTLVMTAPVQKAVSAIQLEAYKRYILVSLITYGQLCPLPKYVTPAIEKTCKKQSACYFALIDAFNNQDIGKLTSVIQRNQKTFDTNGLLGLTKQLIQASYRKKIMALTSIYYKIKLDDLAHHISPHSITPSPLTKDQIEHLLIDMIGKNHIKATISMVLIDGVPVKMIQFDKESSLAAPFSSPNHQLEQALTGITHINDQLSIMDKKEGLNKDFQSKYMVLSANGSGPSVVSAIDEEDMDVPLVDDETKGFV